MKIDINLSRKNRFTLSNLCKRLLGDFKKVKISKKTIILKRRWYSTHKITVQLVDLVLLQIPQAINELYEEYNMGTVFDYADTIENAVEYFARECETEDIIQYLQYQIDNLDMSMALNESFSSKPSLLKEKEQACLKESHATKQVFEEAVEYFNNLITEVIEDMILPLKVVHRSTESACNSPPIRAPGYAA